MLAAGHGQVEIVKERARAVALAESRHGQHVVAAKFLCGEVHIELARLGRPGGRFELFHALFDGKRALVQLVVAHEGPEVQLCRRLRELLELGLILLVFFELLIKAALPLDDVKAVVAAVEFGLAGREVDRALHDAVEKIPVVADDEHRAAKMQQVRLEPLGRAQIEVVGRLVEQEDIRVLQDEPREVHARFFPAGERVKRLRAHLGRDVQTVGDAVALVLHVVPAEAAEVFRQAVVFGQQRGGIVGRHARGQLVHACLHVVETPVRLTQHVLRRPAVGVDRDLRDQPQPPPGGDGHRAGVGLQFAREDAEKRRLAAAVAPENAHTLPGVDVKCDTF